MSGRRHAGPVLVLLLFAIFGRPLPGLACTSSVECDDSNPCTDDLCDADFGCVYAEVGNPCDDGNACSTGDACQAGACVGGTTAGGCTSCQAIATVPSRGGTFVGATSGTGSVAGSCGSTAASPDRVYRWTPTSSGTAVISTCGTGTRYDTVLHVHAGTCGGAELGCNDDTAGCGTGEPNDHHGSRLTLAVTAGQTYVIAVDGYNGAGGSYTLTVEPPSNCGNGIREGAEACDGADAASCPNGDCTSGCDCASPRSALPDLVPDIVDVSLDFGATVAGGDVAEGCAERTSGIDLLRFGAYSRNRGTSDFVLGDPRCPSPCSQHPLEVCGDPDFICSPAAGHNHPHYNNYARYDLLDANGQTIVVGHKQGYCLRDTECASPIYTCTDQGISAGCSDLYGANLGCQYLDITGVPSGTYTLRVTIDPFNRIAEASESNNVDQQTVQIVRPGSTPTSASRTPTRTPTPARTPSFTPSSAGTPRPTTTVTPGAGCPIAAVVPAAGGTFTGTTSGAGSFTGSCGSTGPSPEKIYQWTPTTTGRTTIATCGTGTRYDSVVYVRSGSCTGTQLACNDDTAGCATGEPNDHHGSRVTLDVVAGQTYYLVVDGYNGAAGAYTLTVAAPVASGASATPTPARTPTRTPTTAPTSGAACAAATSIPAEGGTFDGTTAGSNTLSAGCATSTGAPERVYRWVPPRSGNAVIQTCDPLTTFDTIVSVRQPSCDAGPERACNDDTAGCATGEPNDHHGSRLTVAVTAGQTYYVVVDGYQSSRGNYRLRVTPP